MGKRGPKKGVPRTPGSGRKKGTPNKKTAETRQLIEDLGVNPIRGIAGLIGEVEGLDGIDPLERIMALKDLYAKLMPYSSPQLKAIEMSGGLELGARSVTLQFVSDDRPNGKDPRKKA